MAWNTRVAEYVLPGHPDKLADAIADGLVAAARSRERRALVGVEVALHRDVVFVDGRIACESAQDINVNEIVRSVYRSAGYGELFPPHPDRLRIVTDLDLGPLLQDEAEFREYSDDQSIVMGYACSLPGTGFLPVEHALARQLATSFAELRQQLPDLGLGPDGKLIVFVEESDDGRSFRLADLSVSL